MRARFGIPTRRSGLMAGSSGNVADFASSSSGLTLGQSSNMMDHQHQQEMGSSDGELPREEFDSKSGSDNGQDANSGDDQDVADQRSKRKRYHRHTQRQIQEMEAFFKECPHPDDKQRKELGRDLGLEPLQVKFWFQNKRTQMKTQHERHENSNLRSENEKLRTENIRFREALTNSTCPTCGGPTAMGEMSFDEHQLRIENSRLREEIDRISSIAAKYVGKPFSTYPGLLSPPMTPRSLDLGAVGTYGGQTSMGSEMFGGGDIFRNFSLPSEADKPWIVELAVTAMEEMMSMAQMGDPLWVSNIDRNTLVLNEDEYLMLFPRGIGPKPVGFKSEASKETALVIMNHLNLVEILMDVNQWSNLFSSIISRAMTIDVLSTGMGGNYNGAMQVMTAEYHLPSPLVPTRESYFVRYCKQHGEGIWAVMDVSLDGLRPTSLVRCRKRPSGCVIQEMPNGYSKVTWIEHVEVDDRGVHHIYKPLVNAGLAFGGKRWVCTLDRQCERLASAMATNISINNANSTVITNHEGRKSMLRLGERIMTSFCGSVSASTAQSWTTLSGNGIDDVRIMTRKASDDPGRPPGIVLNAATSFWIPVPPKRVFEYLRDENNRNEWDILSNGGGVQEMAHIANGHETGSCVSLLRVNSTNASQSNMLILQESCIDATASYVVYAPIDIVAMNVVLNGGDPEYIALLPSGFAILPDGPAGRGGGNGEPAPGGSLVTVSFQILVDTAPTAKLSLGSVATVNHLIACTVDRIKAALTPDTA